MVPRRALGRMNFAAGSAFSSLQLSAVRAGAGVMAFIQLGEAWSGAGAILAAALQLGIHRRYAAAGLLVAGLTAAPVSSAPPLLGLLFLFAVLPETEAFRWRGEGGDGGSALMHRGWRIAAWGMLVGGHLLWAASTWLSLIILRPVLPAPCYPSTPARRGLLPPTPAHPGRPLPPLPAAAGLPCRSPAGRMAPLGRPAVQNVDRSSPGLRTWSPTVLLVWPIDAYVPSADGMGSVHQGMNDP